ncbi:hypothetical protein, partial [Xanthomonas oryzae]
MIAVMAIDREVYKNGVQTGGVAACMPRNRAPERTRATSRDRSCRQHRRFQPNPAGPRRVEGPYGSCARKRRGRQDEGRVYSRGGNTDSTSSMVVSPAAT